MSAAEPTTFKPQRSRDREAGPLSALPLYQQLFLAAHDEQGRALLHVPSLALGLAGAALLDLVLCERLTLSGDVPAALGTDPIGDPVLDAVFQVVATNPPRPLDFWVRSFGPRTYESAAEVLIARGAVAESVRRRLGRYRRSLIPTDLFVRARLQTDVLHMVYGRLEPDRAHAALCGLLGVLQLERTLDVDAGRPVRARLLALAARQFPETDRVLAAVEGRLGETAVAVWR